MVSELGNQEGSLKKRFGVWNRECLRIALIWVITQRFAVNGKEAAR